jgi:drug/metabolite transporter (DMT)-like permease
VLGEKITVLQIIGGATVLLGVYLVQTNNRKA